MKTIKRQILEDIKEILEAAGMEKVSQGKQTAIQSETHFPAVYINPDSTTYDQSRMSVKKNGYDDYFFVVLRVNTENSDEELAWVEVEDTIIKSILDDSELWTNIIDRNIVTSGYDDYSNYPRRELEIALEFRLRDTEC